MQKQAINITVKPKKMGPSSEAFPCHKVSEASAHKDQLQNSFVTLLENHINKNVLQNRCWQLWAKKKEKQRKR